LRKHQFPALTSLCISILRRRDSGAGCGRFQIANLTYRSKLEQLGCRIAILVSAILIAATSLTACMTEEQFRQESEARCVGYGFKRGTVPFAQCLQNETLAYRQRLAIENAAISSCNPYGFCY
jgi:hypothetical protein